MPKKLTEYEKDIIVRKNEIADLLDGALRLTRGEPGLTIHTISIIMKDVFDRWELRALRNALEIKKKGHSGRKSPDSDIVL